jgi:hypothetical protein
MAGVIARLVFGGCRPVLPNMSLIAPVCRHISPVRVWEYVNVNECGLLKWKSRKFWLFISEDRRCAISGMVISSCLDALLPHPLPWEGVSKLSCQVCHNPGKVCLAGHWSLLNMFHCNTTRPAPSTFKGVHVRYPAEFSSSFRVS